MPEKSDQLSTDTSTPVKIFYCYVHADEEYKVKLIKHLRPFEREKIIAGWHDRNISAGEEWRNSIDEHLESAGIILLLVSADFFDSDYCYEKEMKRAMERHEEGTACVIPIILRSCRWQKSLFEKLQLLPKDGIPIEQWERKDDAYTNVVTGIERAIARLRPGLFSNRATPITSDDVSQPSPRLVEAWFVRVIGPLRRDLGVVRLLLKKKNWSWQAKPPQLQFIHPSKAICAQAKDDLKQFLDFYPDIKETVEIYDQEVFNLFVACKELHKVVEESEDFELVYYAAKADESSSSVRPADAVLAHTPDVDNLEIFAQTIVNNIKEARIDFTHHIPWNKFSDQFLAILDAPSVYPKRKAADRAGEKLLKTVDVLTDLLEKIEDELSIKHGVPHP